MNCRHCKNKLTHVFCDLHTCPPSNAMVSVEELNNPETYFPLKVFVCEQCWLVQIDEIAKANSIFNSNYTYFSSFSKSWLDHSRSYVEMISERFGLSSKSLVIEIASNDGYLLQYFKQKDIPALGVEPSSNTAEVAIQRGIKTIIDFFSVQLAERTLLKKADLIIANNVLAHVPDINDFVQAIKLSLRPMGIATLEFPHLYKLVELNQFDTIYHEHFSYLSLLTVKKIFDIYGLEIFDVEELVTHGGSLRIYVKHKEDSTRTLNSSVTIVLAKEISAGLNTLNFYNNFQKKIQNIKYDLLNFLLFQKKMNKKVIGYGAAAKGNTLLNYCGIKGDDLLKFVVDKSPYKQNKYLPGSRIPVLKEENIMNYKPDYILILPWNLTTEIVDQLAYTMEWGCKFIVAIPSLKIIKCNEENTNK